MPNVKNILEVINGHRRCNIVNVSNFNACKECPYFESEKCTTHLNNDILYYLEGCANQKFYNKEYISEKEQPSLPGMEL